MAFWPSSIETPQEIRTRDQAGRDLLVLSGYAVFDFKGTGGSWKRDDIYIRVGPRWSRLDDCAAVVSLASISNRNVANDAGWAVDNCRWTTYGGRLLLQCQLAVRDSDGYIHRVAYHATALGNL
jgi:hypothetical protein